MKVRIGVGAAAASSSGAALAEMGGTLEALGFDSLWLADVLTAAVDDPLVALAYVAGRLEKLKLGTTLVVVGRNPVRVARQLATLDRLSGGRLLVTAVSGIRRHTEQQAMGVAAGDRGPQMDEMLPLLRRLWTEDVVDHHGPTWQLDGISLGTSPAQDPFDLWVGGMVPAALERAGTLSDGWMASMCSPQQAAAGRAVIEEHAARAGRRIDPEHFGVSIGYLHAPATPDMQGRLMSRNPGVRMEQVVPASLAALRDLIEQFVDVGFSKFVIRPIVPPASWPAELEALSRAVLDLQR